MAVSRHFLLCALLAHAACALQPPPRRVPTGAAAGLTTRLYALQPLPTVGVYPCDGSAGDQAFALNSSTGALLLADGRCLLRGGAGGVSAGACDGTPSTVWIMEPCVAVGCIPAQESWVRSSVDGLVLGVPGAKGPSVDVWTADNPTGACHNELWSVVPIAGADSTVTVRSLCNNSAVGPCPGGPNILNACLTVVPPPPPPPPCTLSPRVACHAGRWDAPPHNTPSNGVVDGPLLGNGDMGAVLATRGEGIEWWLGKGDLWATNTAVDEPAPTLHSDTFYSALSAGQAAIIPAAGPPMPPAGMFSAGQELLNATVWARFAPTALTPGFSVTDAAIAADANILLATLRVDNSSVFNLTLSQLTSYGLPIDAGVSSDGATLWSTKGGVRAVENSMLLMPCDTHSYVIHPTINTFTRDAKTGRLMLANGTAAPPLCPRRVGPAKLSIGPCDDPSGASDWRLVPALTSAPKGALQLASAADATACAWAVPPTYHNSGGFVTIGPCAAQSDAWWAWPGDGLLHSGESSQCLAAVPPNVNVTLGMALRVVRAADGAPVPLLSAFRTGGGAGAVSVSVAAGVELEVDTDYLVILAVATSHDGMATAAMLPSDPLDAALALAGACVGPTGMTFVAARSAASAQFWRAHWAASSVSLGQTRQLLEGFYYGAQYILASTTRQGRVTPGLWGVWAVSDNNGWNGDFTLDYNAQANFYGSCSSNRCEQLEPYLATVGSEWHLEVSRQRAGAAWGVKGSAGGPGQTAQDMTCGPMVQPYEDPAICPLSAPGGYAGIEMTSHIGPFPGLYYYSDLSLRVIAAMSVLPFVDYGEYIGDAVWMNDTGFPILAATGDFLVSYATPSATVPGRFDLNNTCAQEICGGGLPVEHNAHHTLAFARAILAALLRWSVALGHDASKRVEWKALLDGLAPLPVGRVAAAPSVWLEADATEAVFLSNAGAYSIVYTAALHPADVVGLSSPPNVLETAWATVDAIASVSHWRPLNGLCMAWGPATRVAGRGRAAAVLDGWEAALTATMFPNFYPQLDGGGIEQAGATEAINSVLLQSGEGFIRLFSMQPPGENASFTTLRARGAVLVTAAWLAGVGVEPPVTLTPVGPAGVRHIAFLDPWAAGGGPWAPPRVTRSADGKDVPLTPSPTAPAGLAVWVFAGDPAGGDYDVRPAGT